MGTGQRPREAPKYVCAFQNNRKYAIKSVEIGLLCSNTLHGEVKDYLIR